MLIDNEDDSNNENNVDIGNGYRSYNADDSRNDNGDGNSRNDNGDYFNNTISNQTKDYK